MNRFLIFAALILFAILSQGCMTFMRESYALAQTPNGTVMISAVPTVTLFTTGDHQVIQTPAGSMIGGTVNSTGQKIARDTAIGWKFLGELGETWRAISGNDLEAAKHGASVKRDTDIAGIKATKEINSQALSSELATPDLVETLPPVAP